MKVMDMVNAVYDLDKKVGVYSEENYSTPSAGYVRTGIALRELVDVMKKIAAMVVELDVQIRSGEADMFRSEEGKTTKPAEYNEKVKHGGKKAKG